MVPILFYFAAILAVTKRWAPPCMRDGRPRTLLSGAGLARTPVYRLSAAPGGTALAGVRRRPVRVQRLTMLVTYTIQRLQQLLPFNPQAMGPVEARSAFNTAASFTTNTNWQGYAGKPP